MSRGAAHGQARGGSLAFDLLGHVSGALCRTSTMTSPAVTRANIYGHRARIGYTSPPLTTEIFPYEFYKIVPAGVTLVITTLAIVVRSNAERMIIDLEAELKVKVSTSAAAQARAAKALGCKKVVVAQPYELSETERIASYGTHFGCEVLGATGWGSAFNQIGRIPRHAALDMGRKLMREHPDADSILLPPPHWPTADAIDALEREFGVNVMAAHQAIVWDALRRCGVDDRIAGFGRLFREF